MLAFISRLFAVFSSFLAEIVFLIAAALTCYGISLIYLPAAFIVGGVLLALAVIDGRS